MPANGSAIGPRGLAATNLAALPAPALSWLDGICSVWYGIRVRMYVILLPVVVVMMECEMIITMHGIYLKKLARKYAFRQDLLFWSFTYGTVPPEYWQYSMHFLLFFQLFPTYRYTVDTGLAELLSATRAGLHDL